MRRGAPTTVRFSGELVTAATATRPAMPRRWRLSVLRIGSHGQSLGRFGEARPSRGSALTASLAVASKPTKVCFDSEQLADDEEVEGCLDQNEHGADHDTLEDIADNPRTTRLISTTTMRSSAASSRTTRASVGAKRPTAEGGVDMPPSAAVSHPRFPRLKRTALTLLATTVRG